MSGNQWKSDETRSAAASDTTTDSNPVVRARWENSIHTVLRQQEEKRPRIEQELFSDEFGEAVTRILNETPEFQGQLHRHADEGEEQFQPLFSRRNLHDWRQHWSLVSLIYLPFTLLKNLWDLVCFLMKKPKSLWSTLLFFLTTLTVSMLLVVFVCHRILMWIIRTTVACIHFIITLLFDVEDLKAICPTRVSWAWAKLLSFAGAVDDFLLFGRRYAAREWNADAHLWKGSNEAQSRTEALWKCPPPSARLGRRRCLDQERMPSEWSRDTKLHALGINYCYVLLRADYVRRQQKYERMVQESNARRAAFARARSQQVLSPSIRQRGLIPKEREESNESIRVNVSAPRRSSSTLVEMREGTKIRGNSVMGELESVEIVGNSVPGRHRALSVADANDSNNDSDSDTVGSTSIASGYHTLDDLSLAISPRRTGPSLSREASIRSDESDVDLDWLDVGTKIGMRILNSEHVQKAVASQETAERIYDISKKVENQLKNTSIDGKTAENSSSKLDSEESAKRLVDAKRVEVKKPVHTMWTSPASAVRQQSESSLGSSAEDDQIENGFASLPRSVGIMQLSSPGDSRPPRSPHARQISKPSPVGGNSFGAGAGASGGPGSGSNRLGVIDSHSRLLSTKSSKQITRRANLKPGTKVVVPVLPKQPGMTASTSRTQGSMFQMATVVKSRRIHLRTAGRRQKSGASYTNCLSVTVKLDKSFLRGADFAEMTFRIRDEWSDRYMPRHSKFPIGACVATSFGLGVLVGWRVEDDVHVITSLWQHRGAGSAHAYLNRDALHGVIEASVGFDVETNIGRGTVVAYVHPGQDFRGGRFFVHVKEGRYKDQVLEFARSNILSCLGAKYIPVIELLREAAQYQLLVDKYKAALRRQNAAADEDQLSEEELFLRTCSKGLEILWASFLKAVEEDKEFDQGLGDFVTAIIGFLEGLDEKEGKPSQETARVEEKPVTTSSRREASENDLTNHSTAASTITVPQVEAPGFWLMNDWFGGIFQDSQNATPSVAITEVSSIGTLIDDAEQARSDEYYKYAFAIVRSLMRAVSIARVSCADEPNLRLALSICYEFLLFVKTILKVQQRNVTQHSLQIWKRALDEIADTFGPIKDRLRKIGVGLAERMEQQGKKAKVRVLRFADAVLSDELLMVALERDDWETSIDRVEDALVKSKLLDEASRVHIHKTIMFIYNNTRSSTADPNAAARYAKQLAAIAAAMQRLASPRRAFLTVLRSDTVLELMERLLVRVFRHDSFASRMLTIHASNFKSLRQLRLLKDFTVAGKLWLPILDAANDELHWAVSNMPEKARELMVPLSQLFSLCVSQFHKLGDGDLTADWLKFLMEDDAVELINEIDVKLILAVEAVCKDIKEVMVILPYYPSIDDDILNLIDEVDLEEFLKEAAEAIEDADRLTGFVREKATVAIERFLDWIPKMSIPVERRELGEGWVLTCRGESGGDLTLSDVIIKRENLCCQVLGGETMFFPMFGQDKNNSDNESLVSGVSSFAVDEIRDSSVVETSILDHVRLVLEQAHREGYWEAGHGGVEKPPSDRYVAFVLGGMPVTAVLNSSIELWRGLEIDDDELLEIVIREVSYQIEWHEEHSSESTTHKENSALIPESAMGRSRPALLSPRNSHRRFNPRVDPTVLYFEMKKLTLNLERFHFRIEKMKRLTIFDPVFEGQGTVRVRNMSMRMRVECRKERITKLGSDSIVPILHLHELDVGIERVKFIVKDTGADWILNQAVKGFEDNITKAVEDNLKEQVKDQIRVALEHLNSYFAVNPDILLGILGITMDDLEENAVWV